MLQPQDIHQIVIVAKLCISIHFIKYDTIDFVKRKKTAFDN
jgi:hypothetical protein